MQNERIDIATVLQFFDRTYDEDDSKKRTYGIRFVTRDGRIKEIFNASKNTKRPGQKSPDPKGKGQYNLKLHGIVRLFDENTEEFRNAKPPHMIEFRPHNSENWLKIFH